MHPHSIINVLRTTSARLALLYAGLFAGSALLLFGVIYWAATTSLAGDIDADLDAVRAALEAQAGSPNAVTVAAAVTERSRIPRDRFRYLVLSPSGDVAAGDLPGNLRSPIGYGDIALAAPGDDGQELHTFRALGETLPDGGFLLVAQDAHGLSELHELIVRSFAWAGGATLLLALLGGGAMVIGVLRRVEAINQASEQIMTGDLGRRLPMRADPAVGDEFDRLAANLNVMLDRIERLVEGLRQVSTDIAHDLRTPLGRLRRTLEAVREETAAESGGIHLAQIDRAIAEADGLLATFGALLRIAQIEAGRLRRAFAAVDLSEVLEAVFEVYGPAAEEKDQIFTRRLAPGIVVPGDRALLTQMVANLVENAIRHAPTGAHVDIALNGAEPPDAPGPRIIICDDGPGIPPAEREKVFRRFYRLDASRGTPGSGLGLTLVAAVAELHGIALRLDDNEPRGLIVTLSFPSARHARPEFYRHETGEVAQPAPGWEPLL
jgi:signal transduction histidine kinase